MSLAAVRPIRSSLLTAALLLAGAGQALADDWGMVVGAGDESAKKVGIIAGWDRERPLWQGEKWHLGLRHEVELGFWDVPHASDTVEFGYSPVFRIERPFSGGVRLLSNTRMSSDTNLSTAFQFSDMLGVGYQWGPKQRHTVGTRYVHLSNAGIKKPNDGMNFGLMYYQYKFR